MGDVWNIKEQYKRQMGNIWPPSVGARGLWAGGDTPTLKNEIDYVTLSSTGNAADFGNLGTATSDKGGCSSSTRGVFGGGRNPSPSNVIDFITMSSTGNAADFGDLSVTRNHCQASSNQVRAVWLGGYTPGASSNVIDYASIASMGNAIDFGDLTAAAHFHGTTESPTRGIRGGGAPAINTIDYVEIATLGNAVDFGDLTVSRMTPMCVSAPTRGVFCTGNGSPAVVLTIDFITQASKGDAVDFGDTIQGRAYGGKGVSNSVRGAFGGGYNQPSSSTRLDTINYITIASAGDATDFGDLSVARAYITAASQAHGGLELGEPRGLPVGSGRLLLGGGGPTALNVLDVINISTLGNASDFGDLAKTSQMMAACGSHTRGVWQGGLDPGALNNIGAVEIHSLGNGFDFGDLTLARGNMQQGASNRTRAMAAGGTTPSYVDTVDYITIATAGDSADFGNLSVARKATGGAANSTRGIFGGGYTPAGGSTAANYRDEIDYFTIASTGDSTDFGNLITNRQQGGTCASSTRAIVSFGGETAGRPFNYANSHTAEIDYVTTASTGDASDFGDLSAVRSQNAGNSSETRGISCAGLQLAPGGGDIDIMEYITIASTGNTTDFGDSSAGKRSPGAVSDAHGGLS